MKIRHLNSGDDRLETVLRYFHGHWQQFEAALTQRQLQLDELR